MISDTLKWGWYLRIEDKNKKNYNSNNSYHLLSSYYVSRTVLDAFSEFFSLNTYPVVKQILLCHFTNKQKLGEARYLERLSPKVTKSRGAESYTFCLSPCQEVAPGFHRRPRPGTKFLKWDKPTGRGHRTQGLADAWAILTPQHHRVSLFDKIFVKNAWWLLKQGLEEAGVSETQYDCREDGHSALPYRWRWEALLFPKPTPRVLPSATATPDHGPPPSSASSVLVTWLSHHSLWELGRSSWKLASVGLLISGIKQESDQSSHRQAKKGSILALPMSPVFHLHGPKAVL